MRKKTIKEIKAALPGLESEKVEVLSDELDRVLAIKQLFQSDGGHVLIDVLRSNCSRALKKAVIAAKSGDDKLLTSTILDYAANMDLLATVQDISEEKELRDQLDDAVKEAYPSR